MKQDGPRIAPNRPRALRDAPEEIGGFRLSNRCANLRSLVVGALAIETEQIGKFAELFQATDIVRIRTIRFPFRQTCLIGELIAAPGFQLMANLPQAETQHSADSRKVLGSKSEFRS